MANERTRMDRENRAKQFMPFDALKGFRDALAEKERIVVAKRELSEEQKEELDHKLRGIKKNDIVAIEYFHKDEYLQITGMVSKIDEMARQVKVVNTKISFDDIADLSKYEKC